MFAESLAVPPMPVRCTATTRTERGYEMCHRSEHLDSEAHHVRDRQWFTIGGVHRTPGLAFGVPCGAACGWPDYVVRYLGYRPGAATIGGPPPYRPTRAHRPEVGADTGGPHRARAAG